MLIDLRCLYDEPDTEERRRATDAPITREGRALWDGNPYMSRTNLLVDEEDAAIEEMRDYLDAGGRSLIDLTVDGLDPKPLALQRIAQATGVQIVAGAGIYRAEGHPAWLHGASIDEVAARFVRAVEVGIGGTAVRAGVLGELGTSSPIKDDEVKVLRAGARAHLKTGVSINVHPSIWYREGPRILDILQAEGVDLRRVALSHMDELIDYEYHCSLAVRGAWLSFDTFGSESHFGDRREPTDEERIGALLRLLEAGWAGQIMLAQDVCTKLQLQRYGGNGYSHVVRRIVPALRKAGVSEAVVHELLVDNPRRYLVGDVGARQVQKAKV